MQGLSGPASRPWRPRTLGRYCPRNQRTRFVRSARAVSGQASARMPPSASSAALIKARWRRRPLRGGSSISTGAPGPKPATSARPDGIHVLADIPAGPPRPPSTISSAPRHSSGRGRRRLSHALQGGRGRRARPFRTFFAIASTAGISASSRRSARAPTCRPCRSGAAPDAARPVIRPHAGKLPRGVNPMLNIPLSAD